MLRTAVAILTGVILGGVAAAQPPAEGPGPGRDLHILLLHSYNEGFEWTAAINRTAIREIRGAIPDAQLYVQHMHTKSVAPERMEEYFRLYRDMLAMQYGTVPISAVLVSDNNALDFVLRYRDELFPQAAVVFCGINSYDPAMLAGHSGITGVAEEPDIRGTLDLALRLHPNTKHVAAVSDVVPSARLHRRQLQALMPAYQKRGIEFIELAELSASQLARRLEELPEQTIVLHLSYYQDPTGLTFTPSQGVRLVTRHSRRPVYTMWDSMVGDGVVGGVVTSARLQGQIAARMVVRIVNGTPPSQIPVVQESPNEVLFDYPALIEAGLKPDALPPEARVLHRPVRFFDRYRTPILVVGSIILLLLGALLLVSLNYLRRLRAEDALRRQRNLLSNVLEHVPHFVFWKDRSLVYRGCNRNFARAVGLPGPEAIVGKDDFDLPWPREHADAYRQADRTVIEENRPVLDLEETVCTADGREITALTTKVPLRGPDGRVTGLLGLFRDVTQQRMMEQQLRQAEKMDAIGQLAGGIAHDFNNLLAVIQGNAELIRMAMPQGDPSRPLNDEVITAAGRGAELTQQLLNFARKGTLRIEPVAINAMVAEVAGLMAHSIDRRIKVRHELEAPDLRIRCDGSRLHNAILNLCINARDAMSAGGVLTLGTAVREVGPGEGGTLQTPIADGQYFEIRVGDTGTGMSPQVQARLFEPFYTTKAKGKGTGLGLASVYGCMQAHRGGIEVESAEGEGTTVRLLLPLDVAQEEAAAVDSPSLSPGKGRILLADDEEMVRRFTSQALGRLGYAVTTCADGAEAVDIFQREGGQFDLAILDLIMPRLGGADAIARIRRINADVPILLISGYSSRQTIESLGDQPNVQFLPKPFSVEQLAQAVAQRLSDRPSGA